MNVGLPRFLAQRPLNFWALLGAAVLLAVTATEVVRRFWLRAPAAAPAMPPVLRPGPALAADVQRIIQAHLFGQAEAPAARVAVAPDTRLRLRLVGVISSSPGSDQARAMIVADGGKARGVAVGQPIAGTDAILHAIEANRVLIRRGSVIEQLKLERRPREAADSGDAPRALRGGREPQVPAAVAPLPGIPAFPAAGEAAVEEAVPEPDETAEAAAEGPDPEPENEAAAPPAQPSAARARK
jgi:type II secretory pathway component PulC